MVCRDFGHDCDDDFTECDLVMLKGCSSWYQWMMLFVTVIAWLGPFYGFQFAREKRILLDKFVSHMKKFDPTAVEILLAGMPCFSTAIAIGISIQSAFRDVVPHPMVQAIIPIFILGVGSCGLAFGTMLYILYWLQVLEIMKMQVDKDNAKRKRNINVAVSEAQQKKNAENTRKILGLAKARKTISKRMKHMSMAISIYIFIMSFVAAFLEPTHWLRGVLFFTMWAACATQWVMIIYVILTIGKTQVYMLGRGGIIFAFKVNVGLGIVAMFGLASMSVANLPLGVHFKPWFMDFFGSFTWIFLSLFLLIFPGTINQLLRTPKRNAEARRRRKLQGKVLRSSSTFGSDREGDLQSSKKLRKAAGVSGSGSFIGSSGGSFVSSSSPEGPGAKEEELKGIKGRRPSSFIQVSSAPQRAGLDFNENAAKNAEANGGASAADSAMANTLMLPAFEAQNAHKKKEEPAWVKALKKMFGFGGVKINPLAGKRDWNSKRVIKFISKKRQERIRAHVDKAAEDGRSSRLRENGPMTDEVCSGRVRLGSTSEGQKLSILLDSSQGLYGRQP
mmetsp:Transcript_45973/g.127785  ORF Transcript_45973/g.127785 Transcript_45973/m.127785 type:complete len:561 (-) Transcript_45973:6-1688(-)